MTGSLRTILILSVAFATTTPRLAAAVSGSYDGQLSGKKVAPPAAAAAAIVVTGKVATGTIAVGVAPAPYAGAYIVTGKASPKRLKLVGNLGGVKLVWKPKISGTTLAGKATIRGHGVKVAGTLRLTQNSPLADGSACDAVYTANQTFFHDQVLGDALVACTACHVPGGQADATRLHVNVNDPLATARAVAPFVDANDPTASRLLEKPLALVPHGGGIQITAGSTQDQELQQWIALVAAAHCD